MSQSIADPGAGRAVVGAVLAAGAGRRFGGPKALVRLDGERLVDRAASLLRDGGCDEIVVVSGAAPLEVAGADVVHNPDWESGMGSSLRTAIDAALARDVAALVVTLVDLPWLGPDAVARVLDAARRGAAVAAATYDGTRGHPIAFGRAVLEPVRESAHGDVGARDHLRAHPSLVVEVDCTGTGDPHDVDTPRDLPRPAD